jgi:hypothetical protein
MKRNPTEADIQAYFWSQVDSNGPLPDSATGVRTKCWLWLGSVTGEGYGRFKANGKTYQASRYAWSVKGKPGPDSFNVSTHCGNRLCVRHLYTRTRAEIIASVPRVQRSGEDSHLARLAVRQVILMRELYGKGNVTQAVLAKRFGISTRHVKDILARRSWEHI